ncbi:proton channel OtopLc-like isoform X2 [Panonychus citri]|uniref:proton channel OtopLc-like isoform X2 n=1 Tax=Panonychus citri TaxID=50023 RepID=UPI0023077487|nr:proton channel OtopLc-like isoform X2 [Panonychus citri]
MADLIGKYQAKMRQLASSLNGGNGSVKRSIPEAILAATSPKTDSNRRSSSIVSLISTVSSSYSNNNNSSNSHQNNNVPFACKPLRLCQTRHSIPSLDSIEKAQFHGRSPSSSITNLSSPRSSFSSSSSCCEHRWQPKNPKTAAFIVASSIYGQLLVVTCLTFFTAEIRIPNIPLYYFEGFYLYLYAVSLLFLLYVYVYLLHDLPKSDQNQLNGKKKDKISETERSHGSIFLRIGAVGFGLGTMIYNGLEFGSYFEIPYTSPCYSILLGVNPVLQATFTFAQMYFIFTYSRLMINKFKLIARIGLMHLVGTNICVWIRTLGKETLQELKATTSHSFLEELILPLRTELRPFNRTNATMHFNEMNTSNPCQKEQIMGSILADTSPYLYPFIVEYSLIGAAFLYVMWSNIGRNSKTLSDHCPSLPSSPGTGVNIDSLSTSSRESSALVSHSLYSCLGSSKGLFCGFLFLVVSITSLIIFFVLVHHPTYNLLATLISDISHSTLLILSSLAIILAYFKIRKLRFQPGVHETADGGLRDLLLRIAAFGLYVYSLFGVIAGAMDLSSMQHFAVLITSTLTIIQVTLQSLFISDVVCRKRTSLKQPGRQLITFLLIANLTLWVIYTFEMQKVEASPVQLRIYGFSTWALIVRITLPLSIFYRFHSAITFAEVWKNSYK